MVNRLTALLVGAGLALAGCSSKLQPLSIAVRDHDTRAPVVDAEVRVRQLSFYVPVPEMDDMFIPRKPHPASTARTGADGRVQLVAPADGPFEVMVFVPFAPVQGLSFADHPHRLPDRTSGWIELLGARTDPSADPLFDIRLDAELAQNNGPR